MTSIRGNTLNKIKKNFRSLFLSIGFLGSLGFSILTHAAAPDFETIASKALKDCNQTTPSAGANGAITSTADTGARAACAKMAIREIEKGRKSCDAKDTECRASAEQAIDDLESVFAVTESKTESRRKERCESLYEDDKDIYKECSKVSAKQARSCSKIVSEGGGFMGSDEMQMATPMLGMVSGADTLLGLYSAMNDRPDCTLSKDDFKAQEDKLEEQKKDLEEKVKDNMKEAEDAQTEYSEKLKAWAESEGKIADRLNEMPAEKEDAMHKLDNEKLKAKMQADSNYNSVVDQMGELRRKYNDMVSAKAVALAENSDFAIHDRCSIVATGGDPTKQNTANAKPTQSVQSSFAGAFAQGKVLAVNIQKRYDACIKTESLKQKRVESTFVSELSAIKAKLASMDTQLGQINEQKRIADQEIIYQMQNIEKNAANEAKKLAAEYQRIQTDKMNEQTLLKSKLERLNSETKKYQQQLAVLAMKLSMYSGRRPAKQADDKTMADMLNQCGESYSELLAAFQSNCCKPQAYIGSGANVCRYTYTDYSKPAEKKPKEDSKGNKKAGAKK